MAIVGQKNAVHKQSIATKAKHLAGNEKQYLKTHMAICTARALQLCLEKVRRTWHVTVLFCMSHVLGLPQSGNLRGRKKGSGSIEDIQNEMLLTLKYNT
jgi:hypothetical protein